MSYIVGFERLAFSTISRTLSLGISRPVLSDIVVVHVVAGLHEVVDQHEIVHLATTADGLLAGDDDGVAGFACGSRVGGTAGTGHEVATVVAGMKIGVFAAVLAHHVAVPCLGGLLLEGEETLLELCRDKLGPAAGAVVLEEELDIVVLLATDFHAVEAEDVVGILVGALAEAGGELGDDRQLLVAEVAASHRLDGHHAVVYGLEIAHVGHDV